MRDGISQVIGIVFHCRSSRRLLLAVQNNTIVFLLEPLHGVFLCETVLEADHAALASSLSNVVSCWDRELAYEVLLRILKVVPSPPCHSGTDAKAALSRNWETLLSAHGLDVESVKISRFHRWHLIIVLVLTRKSDTYQDGPRRRRSQDHRYRSMDRIWYPNRCVPEYRNRSFRFVRSSRVSTRILGPGRRNRD